ncbi:MULTISPECIES: DUF5131 family protein [unclassified Mameliella]|uniref:DUF5131 family protein n=1 Tax=unclassified Mameliella TaxID=2630630 RepID=UPI00273EC30A|nr:MULTISPECIES: phage Gp37/Gp68 family protein [unclassified Mameliella]
MAEHSKIEWTDHTFNPWIGCTKVSPACDHCYAEAQDKFRKWTQDGWGPHGPRRRTSEANWRKPLAWDRAAQKDSVRRKVFCASLADVFDNHRSIAQEWRRDLWQLIEDTPHLDWLLLTKRPQNFAKLAPARWIHDGCPPNVWIGTTVENQAEANRRIPELLRIRARVRFLSCEPLLGPVDLTAFKYGRDNGSFQDALRGKIWMPPEAVDWPKQPAPIADDREAVDLCRKVDWIIAGGESGTGARPSNPQWFRDLRDQCAAADVPFHFKQWGEWASVSEVEGPGDHHTFPDGRTLRRIGKKRAGRALDGEPHDGFPTP